MMLLPTVKSVNRAVDGPLFLMQGFLKKQAEGDLFLIMFGALNYFTIERIIKQLVFGGLHAWQRCHKVPHYYTEMRLPNNRCSS